MSVPSRPRSLDAVLQPQPPSSLSTPVPPLDSDESSSLSSSSLSSSSVGSFVSVLLLLPEVSGSDGSSVSVASVLESPNPPPDLNEDSDGGPVGSFPAKLVRPRAPDESRGGPSPLPPNELCD